MTKKRNDSHKYRFSHTVLKYGIFILSNFTLYSNYGFADENIFGLDYDNQEESGYSKIHINSNAVTPIGTSSVISYPNASVSATPLPSKEPNNNSSQQSSVQIIQKPLEQEKIQELDNKKEEKEIIPPPIPQQIEISAKNEKQLKDVSNTNDLVVTPSKVEVLQPKKELEVVHEEQKSENNTITEKPSDPLSNRSDKVDVPLSAGSKDTPPAVPQPSPPSTVKTDDKDNHQKSPQIDVKSKDNVKNTDNTKTAPQEKEITNELIEKRREAKASPKKNIPVKAEEKPIAQPKNTVQKEKPQTQKIEDIEEEDITIEEIVLDNEILHRPVYDCRNTVLPPSISKKQYSENNRHLPKVFYQNEYTNFLFNAVKNDDIQGINSLLQNGANINAQDITNGYTPMMYAIKYNRINALRYLIKKGAEINKKSLNEQNALHIAISLSNGNAVEVLLSAGIDATARDKYGKRPSDYIKTDFLEIAPMMISNYQDINKALIDFVSLSSLEAVQKALQQGANINCKDDMSKEGDTPLIIAIKSQDLAMIALLLNNGADLNKKNNKGQTPIEAAIKTHNKEIIDTLRSVKINQELARSVNES